MTVNGPMTWADRVATLEEAKALFQKSWARILLVLAEKHIRT